MWESLATFWRYFSEHLCESALFADSHRCAISIRPVSFGRGYTHRFQGRPPKCCGSLQADECRPGWAVGRHMRGVAGGQARIFLSEITDRRIDDLKNLN